jgi:crossover junction endodeoxyribonuclease RuvC
MIVLGIDPGSVTAAFAYLDTEDPFGAPFVGDVPVVNKQVDAVTFHRLLKMRRPDVAIIEAVGSMPKDGNSRVFRFGMGCGLLRGVIQGLGIPLHEVTPAKWKHRLRLDSDGEKSRARALALYPGIEGLHLKKHHNRAEALLLALYYTEVNP